MSPDVDRCMELAYRSLPAHSDRASVRGMRGRLVGDSMNLKRKLVNRLAFSAGFLASGLVVVAITTGHTEPSRALPDTQSYPEQLANQHDCWSGEAPPDMEGKIPGHVVATRDGKLTAEYLGTRWVGKALEQVFEGAEYNLTVHAFCR